MYEALNEQGYQRLTAAIIKQALYDYARSHQELLKENPQKATKMRKQKASVIAWMNIENGTFQMCAQSWGMSKEQLKGKFKQFFRRIRNGGSIKQFSINDVYE